MSNNIFCDNLKGCKFKIAITKKGSIPQINDQYFKKA